MCGIAGFSLAPDERCQPTTIARAMLREIAHRGPDATGAAWVAPKTLDVYVQKEAVPASRFAPGLNLEGARTCIMHTRWATKGSTTNALNNHPIDVHGIVGVHNGVIRNDDAVFDLLDAERFGQVDSEAAFALLNYEAEMSIGDRLSLLEGSAALAWLTVDDEGKSDRVLHLARVASSPLWIGQTDLGSTFFGSTRRTLVAAVSNVAGARLTFEHEVPEGCYVRVSRGRICEAVAMPQSTPVVGRARPSVMSDVERMAVAGATA